MEGLFPLDGSRRLGGDVVDAAVDALDLVDNAVGNSGKKVVGESVPIGSHVVGGLHAADRSGLCVSECEFHRVSQSFKSFKKSQRNFKENQIISNHFKSIQRKPTCS